MTLAGNSHRSRKPCQVLECSQSDSMALVRYASRVRFFLQGLRRSSKMGLGASALFVGCGTAEEISSLHSMCPLADLIGLDIERGGLPYPASTMNFLRADAQCIPVRDSCLDFCYCFHSLEHIADPAACVSEIADASRRRRAFPMYA